MDQQPAGNLEGAFVQFKEAQKQVWASFAPLAAMSAAAAPHLVRHARLRGGERVLDVACGTGVVAITAARAGCVVTGLDLTPPLLEHARENAQLTGLSVDWQQGDVEQLPFDDSSFDVVLSQFGHMFGPRPELATGQMLRVLKPGGTIAFSTWPPEFFVGRLFALVGRYMPPPLPGTQPPQLWGDPRLVRERLGEAVTDIVFDSARMLVPALSPQHSRAMMERAGGPTVKLVEHLQATDQARLASLRAELDVLAEQYFQDNTLRQDFLLTRARKR